MKLLVLDGNSILNRAFYGIKLLSTRDGLYTNGIYGFLNILGKLRADVSPDAIAAAFDLAAPTFRHKAFDGYKAGRKPMPQELGVQMPILKELLGKMGVRILETEGFEADDILGTEAAACEARKDSCVIATGDRDSLQLVSPLTTVLLAGTKGGRPETTVYDQAKIMETYGVKPLQLIDVKALMGDASDRYPGVAGVGEKTALSLISKYGSLSYIYDNLASLDIRPSLRAKLEAGHESALLSRGLAEIRRDAPVPTDPGRLEPLKPDTPGLARLMARLELFKLMERMGIGQNGTADPAPVGNGNTVITAVKAELAPDGKALFDRLKADGHADFCSVYQGDAIAAAAFAFDSGISVATAESTKGFDEFLKAFFPDAQISKRTFDIKRLAAACIACGVSLEGDNADLMLAGYLLNPLASSYEPMRLCQEYGVEVPPVDTPFGLLDDVIICARQALALHLCAGKIAGELAENGQEKLFRNVEMPLAYVLAQMEGSGFRVDAEGIRAYGSRLSGRLDEMQREIYGIVGYEFNINSTKQLGEALFVKLGLPAKKKTKTGYSTNAEVLEKLRGYHPVIDTLLEFRKLSKLKSTYTDGLLKVIAPDGRIHSSFNQVETRTGRISSTEPNLQNIPVRTEEGRQMRRFFVASEGCELVDADYSQIELRILAHIADDGAMIEAFNNHVDIHTLTASQVFNIPVDFVTPIMRSHAKAVNFGIVYGIGAFSLSQNIGVSVREADQYIKNYLNTFSGVRDYMENVIRKAHENGYVETLLGRRRALPELSSSNRNVRAFGERVARNTPIQGTAADVIKIAMIRVSRRLKGEGLKARLILQVHDELIVEAPREEVAAVSAILKEEMEGAVKMRVRLEADVHSGKTWFDAKE